MPSSKEIDATIRAHLSKLAKPGVLIVRPGYEIAKHRLTGKQAIVATVHTKKSVPKDQALPNAIGGIPVDVRGIETNRDAGVILENADIAKYFEAVFLSDWDSKAKPFGAPSKRASGAKKGARRTTKKTAKKSASRRVR